MSAKQNITKANQGKQVALEPLSNMETTSNVPTLMTSTNKFPLEVMFDVPINLVFEVGRTDITIKQLMELKEGSFVELHQVSVDSIDVRVNDKIIARAETIAMQHLYGIRFGELEVYSALENEAIDVTKNNA